MCENDKCVVIDSNYDEGFIVEIQVEDMNMSNMNISEIQTAISNLTKIDPDKIKIRADIDDDGQVVRILVIVEDEKKC